MATLAVFAIFCFFVNLTFLTWSVNAYYDFCSIERAKCGGRPHIGCKSSKAFTVNPDCYDIEVVPMTAQMQNLMVAEHNKRRSTIASGKTPKYPAASRMLEMTWDNELAETACEHVKYCRFDHDKCRATYSYDHPGQNLRKSSDYVENVPNYDQIIRETVADWFDEYSHVSPAVVDKYRSGMSGRMYGHFTVMSREGNDRVGCCMMQYLHYERRYWWRNTFVTCNYRETNFIGEPMYDKGSAASRCKDWGTTYTRSKRNNGLCTDNYWGKDTSNSISYEPYAYAGSKEDKVFVAPPPELLKKTTSKYCELETKSCKGVKHIGCEVDPPFEVNAACKNKANVETISMKKETKEMILLTHNSLRDLIAGGAVNTYPTASKMLEMQWDNELAEVACQHVKFCQNRRDQCRSTASYSNPGQIIKFYSTSDASEKPENIMQLAIFEWFENHNRTSPSIIDSYRGGKNEESYGQFTVMANERNDKVGCCYVKYKEQRNGKLWYNHLFTCNYREDNKAGSKVYQAGEPQSQCFKWGLDYKASDSWGNLCTST